MSKDATTDLVRPSRDGDQYHYARGARLCLEMLLPDSELKSVTIEGTSDEDDISAGEEVIDLGLYYGSSNPANASRVAYRQFKHSSRHANDEMTASALKKTLIGFAKRYLGLLQQHGADHVERCFRFQFETNRPIASDVIEALQQLAEPDGGQAENAAAKYLQKVIPLSGDDLSAFARLIILMPLSKNFLEQRRLLDDDFRAYLPDNDKDAPMKLRDLVTRKATTEFEGNPAITRHDVLEAIGTREADLFPAQCLIETPLNIVQRPAFKNIAADIAMNPGPFILEADGGVGKSVATTQIGEHLPAGSRTIIYDCFGNGGYRSVTGYRHRAKDGLVQLANQLASEGYCHPLIPTSKADSSDYGRAFKARVEQASEALQEDADALLVIVIDAADNSEMAALEANDGPSFVRSLLREKWPNNVRLVATARPHRVHYLNPPPYIKRLVLLPFSEDETAANFRAHFPDASKNDVKEFHRVTSQNPRVQANAMSGHADVERVLKALGPTPRNVDDTIAMLLESAVAKIRDAALGVEQEQIDRLCTALATLRPFVPLAIVAKTAEVEIDLVRSIANDLERPLIVQEDAVQFRDEPTETWFRERFKPSAEALTSFAERLLPLAGSSAYVSAMLPQIMLEAGKFDELVSLALSGEALPDDSAIARRDVELQRLQFALKAALRKKRYLEAVKLALKAGGEAAADERQQALLSQNTDLAALFLEPQQLVEQVSRRLITGGEWTGSEHAYEAAILSGNSSLTGDARSRLRFALEWLDHWLRRSRIDEEHSPGDLRHADLAEITLAFLNLDGPVKAASWIRRWTPRAVSYRVGRIIGSRLIDGARFEELDAFASAAGNNVPLIAAIAVELMEVGRYPPEHVIKRNVGLMARLNWSNLGEQGYDDEDRQVEAVTAMVAAACHWGTHSRRELARLITRNLPSKPPQSLAGRNYDLDHRSTFLRAYALRACCQYKSLQVVSLVPKKMRVRKRGISSSSPEFERFEEIIGRLLPWHKFWAETVSGKIDLISIDEKISQLIDTKSKSGRYYLAENAAINDEIATIWSNVLARVGANSEDWLRLRKWQESRSKPLFTNTLAAIARIAARHHQASWALDLAGELYERDDKSHEDAETKAESLIKLARAVWPVSVPEARIYFDNAILIAGRIGSENLDRWNAILHLANAAAADGIDDPVVAYRLARGAELSREYIARDKHFEWEFTVESLIRLSPRSGFAILSRWADRRFYRQERLLPAVVESLCRQNQLDWQVALCLLPFKVQWELEELFREAVAKGAEANQPGVETVFWRYAKFLHDRHGTWQGIAAAARDAGLDTAEAEARSLAAEAVERLENARNQSYSGKLKEDKIDWEAVFDDVDLASPQGLEQALKNYRDQGHYYSEPFFAAAYSRVAPGQESGFFDAIRDFPDVGLYELRAALQSLPEKWKCRLSAKVALQNLLKSKFRELCFDVSANSHYGMLPLDFAASSSGLTARDLAAEAVEAIGNYSVPMRARSLFRLAGLLAIVVREDEGRAALCYGLDLFEPLFKPEDGDGPWIPQLTPPADALQSAAGFLRAALASPEAARRWEAAHSIRNLALIGRTDLIEMICAHTLDESGGCFSDRQLRFYDKHALLWLMIALARSAGESPKSVAPLEQFLRQYATRDNLHVLVRHFAAAALLALARDGSICLSTAELESLQGLNRSNLQPTVRRKSRSSKKIKTRPYDEERFHFGIDFPKYHLYPLGRPFQMSDAEIEIAAEQIIKDDWKLSDTGKWDEDQRSVRKYFRNDWTGGRGEMGKADELSFYISYHATMTLAGKLLEERPLFVHKDNWYSFDEWIDERELARADGLWLFDTRLPAPQECIISTDVEVDEWPSTLQSADVESLPFAENGSILMAGYWQANLGSRTERVRIDSALVEKSRGAALARAIVNAPDPDDFALPDTDGSNEIDNGKFTLKGWTASVGRHDGLDKLDPWAKSLSTQRREITESYLQVVGLSSLEDGLSWTGANGEKLAIAQAWADVVDEHSEKTNGGNRLVVSSKTVDELISKTGNSVILYINVRRAVETDYRTSDGGKKHGKASIARAFLFEAGKTPRCFGPGDRIGRANCCPIH